MFGKWGDSQNVPEGSQSCAELGENWPPLLRFERRLLMPLYRISDTGVLGLTPLRTHILVCGFPRSGTTLLQLMLENALPEARRFGRETAGWRAATYAWRNHAIIISKMPHDLFRLAALRNFYSRRPAALKIILMLRDPRDVLTSQRKFGGPEGYCVSSQRWRNYYNAFVAERTREDCLVVRYEDLVADPDRQQRRIEQFTSETMRIPFSDFHSVERPDFEADTLNGLRPVETNLVRRWAAPECRERIAQVLDELAELPEALTELGYEGNTDWIGEWRGAARTGTRPSARTSAIA
jgi:hypothetical protein